jgi:hypothetical protein
MVRGRFTWHHAPGEQLTTDAKQCIEDEKKRIRESFSAERVQAIVEEVKSSRRELVYKRVFDQVLLQPYYDLGVSPPCDSLEKLRNWFEWSDAVIEYLPWWMTPAGRERREALRQRLLSLPGDVRSDIVIDDTLVASAARVYLPIRPGHELDVARLLATGTDTEKSAVDDCVERYVDWRDEEYAPLEYPLPTYEQVTAIDPALGTPAGTPDWLHDWERPRRRFTVMDEWAELLPTDGVHIEPALSACGSADSLRTSALVADLAAADAVRDAQRARAELDRELVQREDVDAEIVVGDPAGRRPL